MKFKSVVVLSAAMVTVLSTSLFVAAGVSSNGGSAVIESGTPEVRTTQTVDGGLGTWTYGTGLNLGLNKTVYSNLDHGSKYHRSSCSVSTGGADESGWVQAKTQSKSNAVGVGSGGTAYVNWDVE
jgi:lactococcin 972 family bacteriocin